MADPVHIGPIGRTCHTSNSGIEIISKWHIQPYESHTTFIKTLQGFVAAGGTRNAPCRDQYIQNCYCTECEVNFAHADAAASTQSIDDFPGTLKEKLEGRRAGEATVQKPTTAWGTAGAIVTAHYRPLITAWQSEDENEPDIEELDWLDPTLVPGIREIPWPPGLFVKPTFPLLGKKTYSVPDDVALPIGIPISDFSIRRILVNEVPWQAMEKCNFGVNKENWPGANSKAKGGLPTFYSGTLKFMGADVQNMVDTEGTRWYSITYHFKWINFGDTLVDFLGDKRQGRVTWNHILMKPTLAETAWYQVSRAFELKINDWVLPQVPGKQVSSGNLYNLVDFDELFE